MGIIKKDYINIDIETYSEVDLKKSGEWAYAAHPSFEILLFAYSINGGPVEVLDLTEGTLPKEIIDIVMDPKYTKKAFRASFERVCISEYLNRLGYLPEGEYLHPEQWSCTMVRGLRLGLPGSLEAAARVCKVALKDGAGKDLIKLFSVPCKPTKVNGGRTRNLPEHFPEKWDEYIEYNRQDVVSEMALGEFIDARLPFNESEEKLWDLDQLICDRGIFLDVKFVEAAIELDRVESEKLLERAKEITGVSNPNSGPQVMEWMRSRGVEVDSLAEASRKKLLRQDDLPDDVREVLIIKDSTSISSVGKYTRMIHQMVERDQRVRGVSQFYGASRTGRWAGRGVQVQNLTKHSVDDPELPREYLREMDVDAYSIFHDEPIKDMLRQLVRTSFIAESGNTLYVSDFSAIEARVIAWLADEKWRLEVFQSHGKIYEASASEMFNVPLEEITKDSPLRGKGKIAELALGYQGGPGALESMGALSMGLEPEELPELVKTWRNSNKGIVNFWYDSQRAAESAIRNPGQIYTSANGKVRFQVRTGILFIRLPSGRELSYPAPRMEMGNFGREVPAFMTYFKQGGWRLETTYGGKLVENIVQATARDCLAYSMVQLESDGYPIIFHVHDEVVIEVPKGFGSLEHVEEIMGQDIPWAKGLPLRAEGFETWMYMKD